MPKQSNRGGRQEPLAPFDIHIPTWTKYQQGKAERFVRVERATRHNRQLAKIPAQYRWVWLSLVLAADADGWVRGITDKDVAFEAKCKDLRMVRAALKSLHDGDLIQCSNLAGPKQDQGRTKAQPKQEQSKSEAIRFELSSDGAGYGDTEKMRTEEIRKEIKAKKPTTPPGFDAFWAAYPNHGSKADTVAQWLAIDPDETKAAEIMAGLERAKLSKTWADGFVVQAARFLRDERWTDAWPAATSMTRSEVKSEADTFFTDYGVE